MIAEQKYYAGAKVILCANPPMHSDRFNPSLRFVLYPSHCCERNWTASSILTLWAADVANRRSHGADFKSDPEFAKQIASKITYLPTRKVTNLVNVSVKR